ncbi:hypothetical protein Hanom_Chr11g00988071 [Helianthus anomalus]
MNATCVTPKLVYFFKKYLLGAFLIFFLPKTLKNMYITCVNFFQKKKTSGALSFPGFSKLKWVFYTSFPQLIIVFIHASAALFCRQTDNN